MQGWAGAGFINRFSESLPEWVQISAAWNLVHPSIRKHWSSLNGFAYWNLTKYDCSLIWGCVCSLKLKRDTKLKWLDFILPSILRIGLWVLWGKYLKWARYFSARMNIKYWAGAAVNFHNVLGYAANIALQVSLQGRIDSNKFCFDTNCHSNEQKYLHLF